MEISEIINDAIYYPLNHIKSLLVYLVLGFIAALVLVLTGFSSIAAVSAKSGAITIVSIIGLVITVILLFLIDGYVLDIVKYGIQRSDNAPSIDPVRQISNGIKLVITQVVYYIIPVIITFVLSMIFRSWIVVILGLILFILFGLIAAMAECRLAETDDLGSALAVSDAYNDLTKIGIGKVIITVAIIFVITVVVIFILSLIGSIINQNLGTILASIGGIYTMFFSNRAFGLLYSDA